MAQLRSLLGMSNPSLKQLNEGAPTLQPGASLTPGYYSGGSAASPGSGSQSYTTAGTYSFTVPSGVTRLRALLTGGGGGGAGVSVSFNSESQAVDATSIAVTASAGNYLVIIFTGATDGASSVSGSCTVNTADASSLAAYTYDNSGTSVGALAFGFSVATSGTQSISLSVSGFQGATTYSQLFVLLFNGNPNPGTVTTQGMDVSTTSDAINSFTYSATQSICIMASNGENGTAVTPSWNNAIAGDTWSAQDTGHDTLGTVALASGASAPSVMWPTYTTGTNGAIAVQILLGGGGGGGGAVVLLDLIAVSPGELINGTVGAGGSSGSTPTAGGTTSITIGSTTYTSNGGGAASASTLGTGGEVSTQSGVYLSSAGGSGTSLAGGVAGSINGQIGGGAGATGSSAAGPGGGGFASYNGGNGQVIIQW